ncbi:MAG: cyclic-phosphate processing receiver domain-containing protein [Minisyncoccia bacterium]
MNPNTYILEDDLNRMKWFNREFIGNSHSETADGIINLIKGRQEYIDILFLDHDLGGEQYVDSSVHNTGMTVVKWLCEPHNCALTKDIGKIVVHSLNRYAATQMTQMLHDAGYDASQIPFIHLVNSNYD